jgi:ribosome biogenesis GTPase
LIHAVLPRKSKFSRKVAGQRTDEQVVAANVDTLFLVSGLDGDFNPRRIERYLTAAWDSGARPVVVLNKLDRCDNPDACLLEVEAVAMGVPVHRVSALKGTNVEELTAYLGPGQTVGLLGSSGVGKSTLVNHLLGEERMATGEVRASDSRGRHVTSHRQLIVLPGGAGILVDTPGLRELQLWGTADGLAAAFSDVEALARSCRFRDCGHGAEPGCAVRDAVSEGRLAAERVEHFARLGRELRHLAGRQDALARRAQVLQAKVLARAMRRDPREKHRR